MSKILLLENIHPIAVEVLEAEGHSVDLQSKALNEEELIAILPKYDVLGIRSKTYLTDKVFQAINNTVAVGCFCVGTNQVDLGSAKKTGVTVFNAPFSNTRSVAEMVIAEIIMLSRKIGTRNNEMHSGVWNKSAVDCHEVRGKTLGIIGYGNIGFQVSLLAEALGMRVLFFDVVAKLPVGNAKPVSRIDDLLKQSDFVTLHVPEENSTKNMMGADQFAIMKENSYLINAARGTVVDLDALKIALETKKLAGAAIDVFPIEPEKANEAFITNLRGLDNLVMTPHIGGATEEAQVNIGREVAATLARFLKTGSTTLSVNQPDLDLGSPEPKKHRISNLHKNVPGVLKEINHILSEQGVNIQGQALKTDAELGYVIIDLDQVITDELLNKIQGLKTSIRSRRIS